LPLPGRHLRVAAFAQREEQRLCHSCDVSTTGFFPCLHCNAKVNLSKSLE
jgi:hypothetical protein